MRRKILFTKGQRLTVSELYQTACGMMEAAGFHLELTIAADGLFQGTNEYARVYTNGVISHVVYYPGKDTDDLTHFPKVIPLSHLRNVVQAQLAAHHINSGNAVQHYFIAEVNKLSIQGIELTHAEHYIYAHQFANKVTIEDSMDRNLVSYDNSGIKDAMGSNITFEEIYHGEQTQIVDSWQCGHFAAKYFQNQILLRPGSHLEINREILVEHSSYYNRTEQVPVTTSFFERHYIIRNILIASVLILGIAGISLAIVASHGILGGVLALAICASIGSTLTLTGIASSTVSAINNYFNKKNDLTNLQNAPPLKSTSYEPKARTSQADIYLQLNGDLSEPEYDEDDLNDKPTLPLLLIRETPQAPIQAEGLHRPNSQSHSTMRPN